VAAEGGVGVGVGGWAGGGGGVGAGGWSAVAVEEHEPGRDGRVAGDRQVTAVDGPVAAGAEGDQVLGVGGAAVFPVPDVVDVEEPAAPAVPAAVVAVFDETAEERGDGVLLPPEGDGGPVAPEDGPDGLLTWRVAATTELGLRRWCVGASR
jgi:hypothetical protein